MCEIHIVGLDHFPQILKPKCRTPEGIKAEADQKRCFYEWLRELVVQNGIALIAEGADFDAEFLGSVLVRSLGLDYIITMPRSEWKTRGFRNGPANDLLRGRWPQLTCVRQGCASAFTPASSDHRQEHRDNQKGPCQSWPK
jgi:hypothetical protein